MFDIGSCDSFLFRENMFENLFLAHNVGKFKLKKKKKLVVSVFMLLQNYGKIVKTA